MRIENKGYKKLKVWQKAHEMVILVYRYTEDFPKYEQFGLTSQIRRAVVSVAANIVEGQASLSKKDFLNFLNMANKSLVELEYLLEASRDLRYLSVEKYNRLEKVRYEVGNLLNGFMRSLKKHDTKTMTHDT